MPLTALEGKRRQRQFAEHGVQIIIPPKRINFKTPSGEGSGSWFMTAWFCYKLNLPKEINFITTAKPLHAIWQYEPSSQHAPARELNKLNSGIPIWCSTYRHGVLERMFFLVTRLFNKAWLPLHPIELDIHHRRIRLLVLFGQPQIYKTGNNIFGNRLPVEKLVICGWLLAVQKIYS